MKILDNNIISLQKKSKIFIGGDYAPSKEFILEDIESKISKGDILFLNYEGVSEGIDLKFKKFDFYCPIINNTFLKNLSSKGVTLVLNFCNNHAMDFGIEGLKFTTEYLNNLGAICFGLKCSFLKDSIKIKRGEKEYCFFSAIDRNLIYHYKKYSYEKFYNFSLDPRLSIKNKITNINLFLHEGIEYVSYPNYKLYKKVKYYFDRNINIFVSQQHVLLPIIFSKGNFAVFGMGNFIFNSILDKHTSKTKESILICLNSDFSLNEIFKVLFNDPKLLLKNKIVYLNKFPHFSFRKWIKEFEDFYYRRKSFRKSLDSSSSENNGRYKFLDIVRNIIKSRYSIDYLVSILFVKLKQYLKFRDFINLFKN